MKILVVLAKRDAERKQIRTVLRDAAERTGTPLALFFTDRLSELASLWERRETAGILSVLGETERLCGKTAGNGRLIRETSSYGVRHFDTGMEAARYVRMMIRLYYRNGDSVRQYAEAVHIAPTYLCRLFKRLTGETVGNYILRLRMEEAGEKLLAPEAEVRAVAAAVGYSNLAYFYRRFRTFYQMSPEEYRRTGGAGKREEKKP